MAGEALLSTQQHPHRPTKAWAHSDCAPVALAFRICRPSTFEMKTMLSNPHRGWSREFPHAARLLRQGRSPCRKATLRPVRPSVERLEDRTVLNGTSTGAAYGQVPLSF